MLGKGPVGLNPSVTKIGFRNSKKNSNQNFFFFFKIEGVVKSDRQSKHGKVTIYPLKCKKKLDIRPELHKKKLNQRLPTYGHVLSLNNQDLAPRYN